MPIPTIKKNATQEILKGISKRAKKRRLEKNLTQRAFAERAGVGYDAYRKFEATGEISLRNLILCAVVLDDTEIFSQLFSKKAYQSIDEIVSQKKIRQRQRASKK